MPAPIPQAIQTISLTRILLISLILISYIHPIQMAYPQETTLEEGRPTLLERGIELLNERRFDEALQMFRDASIEDPENPQPHYLAAIAHQAKGDLKEALDKIEKAAGLAPDVPVVHLRMGIILEQMGRQREAIGAYKKAIETPEAMRGEETPPIREARERLRRVARREYFNAARGFMRQKRYEDAVRELKELLTIEPNDYPSYYLMAIALRDLDRPKEAIEALKKVVEINPRYAEAYAQMGYIYERISAFTEAEESLERFLSLAPESPMAGEVRKGIERVRKGTRFQKGFETVGNLIKDERYDEALRENEVLSGLQPDHPHVSYNFGLIYFHLKRYEEAISYLQKSLEREPKFFLAHQRLAIVYDEMGRLIDAIKEYEMAQANTTDEEEKSKIQARMETLRAVLEVPERAKKVSELVEKGDTEGAIKEAERLIAGRKKDTKLYLILGGLYIQTNRLNEAAKTLETAAGIDPKNLDILMLLSNVYERLGRLAEAASSYKTAGALAGESPAGRDALERAGLLEIRSHLERAKGLKEGGDLEGSLREIMTVLAISPDNPVALFNAGVLNDLLGRPREAESFLRRAIEVRPDYVEAHLQLGLILERERDFIRAERAYSEVVRLQKEGDMYNLAKERLEGLKDVVEIAERTRTALSLIEKKNFDAALKEIRAVISIYPKNYLAYLYMGMIYDQTDNPEEAISALQKSIEIRPNFLQPYLLLGKILALQDKLSEARDTYRKVTEIGKGTREADMAAVQLRRLRPWRGNLSISHTYNTNISYGIRAEPTFQSGYNLSLTYIPWRTKRGGINIGGGSSANIYYSSQLTGMAYSLSVSGDYSLSKDNVASLNLSQTRGFFESRPTSEGFSASTSLRISPGIVPSPMSLNYSLSASRGLESKTLNTENQVSLEISPGTIPNSLSLRYSLSKSRSQTDRTRDADRHSTGISISQRLGLKDSISGSYSFSVNKNTDPRGNNYGNQSHNLSLSYSRSFFSQYSLSLSYSAGFIQYINPDSITFFQRFRRNTTQGAGAGVSLPLSEQVSFSFRYNYSRTRTNLPRPTRELLLTLEEILAEPVPMVGGDSGSHTGTMTLSVKF